ncbi:AAA family ATPase [Paenibacillus sp. GbtcB18]|uniref:AAA family ATPase n=1 Tax=Paenibacillus sp. GbtcB18 TaxID=2824763 RepID=UPI002815EA0D|nr:AAA family ATPase [Paenibacillus sp. GbtcB18]
MSVIIWVNGAFGSGKSQTTHELHRRIPGSFLYDPENAGYFIRKNVPPSTALDDFQDYPMWRESNYGMLNYISGKFDGVILVPMTIVNPVYFDEIVGRLRRDSRTVHHFALCASKETLLKRLRSRGEGPNSWAARQIDRCREGLSQEVFQHHVDTDLLTIGEVSEEIAAIAGIQLLPDNRSTIRKKAHRLLTQLKQIRF